MRRNIIIFGLLLLVMPSFVLAANYDKWNWNSSADGYHVNDPQISGDGNYMAVVGGTDTLATSDMAFFETSKENPVWRFDPDGPIWDVGISENGRYIASCGSRVWVHDRDKTITPTTNKKKKGNRKLLWKNKMGAEVFDACAITPNGKYVVAGSRSDNIYLFDKDSRDYTNSWKATAQFADGVNDLAISDDGKYIVAVTDTSVLMIDVDQDKKLWEYKKLKTDGMYVDISSDGKYAIATEDEKVYLFSKNKKKPIKQKAFDSFHPLQAKLSSNGKYILVSTNDKYYAYKRSQAFKRELWTVTLDERQTDMNISDDGKYIAISCGYDYAFIFDRDYPEDENRPFHYYTGTFVGAVGLNGDGDGLAYESSELRYRDVKPGVLADLTDEVAVYGSGAEMNLRMFMTNPGDATNVKAKVKIRLPQLGWWEETGSDYEDEPQGLVNKLVAKAGKSLGSDTLHTKTYNLNKHASKTKNLELEMPDLQQPSWLGGLLDTLGIGELIEGFFDALDNILPTSVTNILRTGVNHAINLNPSTYPLLGYGEVIIYDTETKKLLDRDSFMFFYLL